MRGVPASERLFFRVYRDGRVLGAHSVRFAREGAVLRVSISIDYVVKLGFVTAFRYRMNLNETWEAGVLMAAKAEADNNGRSEGMRAVRDGEGLRVQGSGAAEYRAPAGAMVASHWNQAQLGVPLINPQNGVVLPLSVEPQGIDAGAERFSLIGKDGFDLWYDATGLWCGLLAKLADGSTVRYVRND